MKTIIITSSPQITSATTFFNEIARAFYRKGYRVIILFDKNNVREDNNKEELIYKTWPSKRPTSIKDLFFLRKLIKKYKPSYIISSFGAVNISLIGGFLFGVKNRIAWSRTKSNQLKTDSTNSKFKDYILRIRKALILNIFATEIHTNSYDTKRDIRKFYWLNKKTIKVIYFLIKEVKQPLVSKENIISFVGRFNTSKGQEKLIKAIPYIIKNNPNYKFYFIGDGITKQTQEKLSKELKVFKYCVFTGNISQKEVYKYLTKSKLHVSASTDEAFGMVNLEAISSGTPILAHKVGGIKEILINEENGFFFEMNDSIDLANKINRILSDNKLYSNLINGCSNTFKGKFLLNSENLNKRIEEIIS